MTTVNEYLDMAQKEAERASRTAPAVQKGGAEIAKAYAFMAFVALLRDNPDVMG